MTLSVSGGQGEVSGSGLSEIQWRRLIELSRFIPFENGWREALSRNGAIRISKI